MTVKRLPTPMSRLLPFIIALVAVVAVSCGSPSHPVDRAVEAAFAGDPERCIRECDDIMSDTAVFNSLTVTQLCTLARLYASIPGDQGSNDGSAVKCLNRARAISNDSVDAFMNALEGDDASHLVTLDHVGAYLEMPRDELLTDEDDAAESSENDHDHE